MCCFCFIIIIIIIIIIFIIIITITITIIFFKKMLYGPFLWMGFNCLKATEPL